MSQLVHSPDLVLVETECSLYMMLNTWMFARVQRAADEDSATATAADSDAETGDTSADASDSDRGTSLTALRTLIRDSVDGDETAMSLLVRARKHKVAFLETEAGRPFEPLFRQLRLQNLLNHPLDLVMVVNDNVIPMSWLQRPLFEQWHSMLLVDATSDAG